MIDPAGLIDERDSSYAIDLLIAAVAEFDFFTYLSRKPSDLETICRELELAERPADVMCTLFAAMGLVVRRDGWLELSEVGEDSLTPSGSHDLRPYFRSLRERPGALELVRVLRTGAPEAWSSAAQEEEWSKRLEDEEFAVEMTAAMDARASVLAPALADVLDLNNRSRLLDVAGGSGIYACKLTEKYAALEATILERPPVDIAARTLIDRRGCEQRVDVKTGDMFGGPFPRGYDVHLFSHVLHDWGEDEVRELLEASFAALPSGGLFVDHDAHINRTKDGPLPVARYSVLLMHSTRGKCWSERELEEMLLDVGFESVGLRPTAVYRSIILALKA